MPEVAVKTKIGAELAGMAIGVAHDVGGGEQGGIMGFEADFAGAPAPGPDGFAAVPGLCAAGADLAFVFGQVFFKPFFGEFEFNNSGGLITICSRQFQPVRLSQTGWL
jgi:hypothetical protein